MSLFQFGETVEGYDIPVVNEREVRGAASLTFLALVICFTPIIYENDFLLVKYFVTFMMTDLSIRLFISPKFSPTLTIARFIVRNQPPIYVGAPQKRFAWFIGLAFAVTIFTFLVVMNTFSPVTGLACLVCEILLFWEAAFGICIGCIFYGKIYKEKAQYCPGDICEITTKAEINKISKSQ